MYAASNPRVRDSQNPYRTGCLVGNYTEDRFGLDLATESRDTRTGITENQARYTVEGSLLGCELQPRTQQTILEDKEFNDYTEHIQDNKKGMKSNIFFGHGPTQKAFENRDFATTNDLVYGERQDVNKIINTAVWQSDNGKTRSQIQTNVKQDDLPSMFGKSGTALGGTQARPYNQYTKKFDNNCMKLGLRT